MKLDKKGGIGELSCKVCGQSFQSGINCEFSHETLFPHCSRSPLPQRPYSNHDIDLSAAVDVYSDWVDACDSVAKDGRDPEEGVGSYGDLGDGTEGERGSEMPYNRHALAVGDRNAADYDEEI